MVKPVSDGQHWYGSAQKIDKEVKKECWFCLRVLASFRNLIQFVVYFGSERQDGQTIRHGYIWLCKEVWQTSKNSQDIESYVLPKSHNLCFIAKTVKLFSDKITKLSSFHKNHKIKFYDKNHKSCFPPELCFLSKNHKLYFPIKTKNIFSNQNAK